MGYMSVQTQTDSELRLLREPTFLSKAVFVGFFIGIIGIFFYGSESVFFKVLIGLCAAGLSCLIVDNYEICEFDKEKSEVRLTRLHWCQYILGRVMGGCSSPYVSAKLEDIKDVRVEEQGGPNTGKAYQVILSLETGIQLGVTEVFTTDDIRSHEAIANLIREFLGFPAIEKSSFMYEEFKNDNPEQGEEEEEGDEDGEDLSSSEDDFEQISHADVEAAAAIMDEAETDVTSAPQDAELTGEVKESTNEELEKPAECAGVASS